MGAKDGIDPRCIIKDSVLVLLRQATAHGNLHAWVVFLGFLQSAQGAIEPLIGILTHGAGIKDDKVWLYTFAGGRVACLLQKARDALGIMHIHLASEGSDFISTGICDCLLHVGIV